MTYVKDGDPWRFACPKCNSRAVYRKYGHVTKGKPNSRYRCDRCGHTFDRAYDLKKEKLETINNDKWG